MKRDMSSVNRLVSSEPRADVRFRRLLLSSHLSAWPAAVRLLVLLTLLLGVGLAGPAWGAAVTAFNYPDFNAPAGVAFFNAAAPVAGVAQLTPAAPGRNGSAIASAAVAVRDGFDTEFQFRILNPSGTPDANGAPGGDGFALIIQGQGPTATGPSVGYIPYSIPNAVALEFDTWRNSNLADPDGNHLSLQDVGPTPNGLAEFDHSRSLGWAAAGFNLSDGAVHTAHVRYRPGLWQVFLDGAATPTLSATLDLSNIGGRSPLLADGSAWLSFAAGTGGAYEAHEILSWSFQSVVPVVNSPPVANAGGPYMLDAGAPLVLNGGGTDLDAGDTLTFAWDLNNDGTFGDASGATPTLSPAALAALGLGNGAHTIFLRVTDTAGASTTVSSALTIRATQMITLSPIADHVFGDAPFTISATASSGLPVALTSLTPSVATVSGNTVTLVGAGTATLRASQAGDANWQPAADAEQTFTVRNESGVWAWGNGDSGQLGNGQTGNSTVPGAVWAPPAWNGRRVLSVAAGLSHCLALLDDGSVWAWGNGAYGQLGNGRTLDWSTPMAVINPVGWTGHKVVSVAAGRSHSLALLDDGSIWAWGDGSAGQLGNGQAGRFYSSNLPVAVSAPVEWIGRKVVSIAAGGFNSLALLDDGRVWAWGHGGSGELGNGKLVDSSVPVAVSVPAEWNGHRVLGVAAGSNHSLAVVDDGSVWAWGWGLFGSLGNGQVGVSSLPVAVSAPPAWAGRRVVSVAAGDHHSLAVLDDGTTWAWGSDMSGQLGNGQTGESSVPVAVSAPAEWNGHKVVGIAAGSSHSLAILDDGSLWSWGEGLDGQLGDDRSLNSLSPVAVAAPAAWTGYRVVSVTAGANYSLALLGELNTAPTVANPVPSQVATYGTSFTFLVPANTFADPDAGQALSYSASGLPAWLAFDANTRTFSGTPTGLGSFTLTVTATDDGTPALSASTTFDLVVGKAPLTATGDTLYRFYGEVNPPLTGTLFGVANGDNITASYTTTATPTGAAGVYTIYVTLNDPDSRLGNYEVTLVTGALRVERAPQTITFGAIPPHVFGDAPFTVPVSSSSGLPVTLTSSAASVATASGTTLTITGAGTTLLTAYQPGDGNYQAAAFVQVSYAVGKATPVIAWATPTPITSSTPLSAAQLNAMANTAGSFAYTPATGTTLPRGTHVLSAEFTPGDAANYTTASATVSLAVLNSAPVAAAQSVTSAEDTAIAITLAGTDADADALSNFVVSGPTHGTFTGTTPNLTYTPAANYHGPDSFTFTVNDGTADSPPAAVAITVTPVNDAPRAVDDAYTTDEDTALIVASPGVLGNDTDADEAAMIRFTFEGRVRFADEDFNAGERFVGFYTLNPTAVPFAHPDPTLAYDYLSQNAEWEISFPDRGYRFVANQVSTWISVGNDRPAWGDRYTVSLPSPASVGAPLPSGRVLNMAQLDLSDHAFFGADFLDNDSIQTTSIRLSAANNRGGRFAFRDGSQPPLEIDELVGPFTVTRVNGQAADVNRAVALPSGALLRVNGNGSFRYDPNGQFAHLAAGETATDSFTYDASDPDGGSATATATITITGVNDAPVANNQSVTTAEDTPLAIKLTGSDAEGDALTYWVLSGADHGDFTIHPPNLVYTPHPNFNGTDVITFRVSDGPTYSAPASVTITVTPVNDLPTADGQSRTTYDNQPLAITLAGADVETANLTYRITSGPTAGTLSGTPPNVTYTPPFPYAGSTSFSFEVEDADGAMAQVTVQISILASDRPPVAMAGPDQSVVAGLDCQATVAVDGSASSDADGDALGFTWQLIQNGAVIDTVAGQAAVSWSLTHGTYEAVLTVSTDKGGTIVSRSDSLVIEVLPSAPVLGALNPTGAYAGGPAFNLTVTGGCFLPGAVVHWNGQPRTTTVVSSGELVASIPASDLLTGVDIAVASIQVVNGDGQVSNALGFSIVPQTVGTADAAIALPGDTASASAPPEAAGTPGVAVTFQNTGGQPASVLAATYDQKPVGDTAFQVGQGDFVDVQLAGADSQDVAAVHFYYASTTTGNQEAKLKLRYFTGSKWVTVRSSGGALPLKDTTDNLDGTVSGGRFAVTFDNTSTPKITELNGTVFGMFDTTPQITAVSGPAGPLALGTTATVTVDFATASDALPPLVRFDWDDGSSDQLHSAEEGQAEATHLYAGAGVYTVTVTVTDAEDAEVTSKFEYAVVYDPNAGFVTGLGWLSSPAGAYAPDPELTGTALFGFVSKYRRGISVPVGVTEFYLHAAHFNFLSTTYDWLVVAGARAQYRGTGKINGEGNYGFILTATDGQLPSGGGKDKLRLKIWDKATGQVIYDNRRGASDDVDAANPQVIGGGSIVIHKAK